MQYEHFYIKFVTPISLFKEPLYFLSTTACLKGYFLHITPVSLFKEPLYPHHSS